MNIEKFVVSGKGTFGFGDECQYWYYNKNDVNFIAPTNLCLFTEVCSNSNIPSKFCLKPINFWCLYLNAIQLKKAFLTDFRAADLGPNNFYCNVSYGKIMCINHYLSLLLYSDWTVFQREFKKYTRRLTEEETNVEFFVRNASVAHWHRYLKESVFLFDRPLSAEDVVYCGISVPLLFDSFDQQINAPLSTTISDRIAVGFAGNEGIILKLQRVDEFSYYFPMEKFSQYSHEEEWFVCGEQLKIIEIGFQCISSALIFSSKKYIRAMLLLEKVLRGQMFVDINKNILISAENVQLLLDLMDAHTRGLIIEICDENKNNNSYKNAIVFADEFLQYMQDLFNHRIQKFTKMRLDRNNDPYGYNQTWLNFSELDRISFLSLKETMMDFLNTNSVNKINFCPKPISILIKGETFQNLQALKEGKVMKIGDIFSIEKNGLKFEWKMEVMRADSSDPDNCSFFLYLHYKPRICRSLVVSFDVICPEMKFEAVNRWERFNKIGQAYGFKIFRNVDLCISLTVCVCIRILFTNTNALNLSS